MGNGNGQNRIVKKPDEQQAIKGYKSDYAPKSQQFARIQGTPQNMVQSQQFKPQVPAFEAPRNEITSNIAPPPLKPANFKSKVKFTPKPFPFDGPECVEDELALRIQKQFSDFSAFLEDTNQTLEKILNNKGEKKKASEVY